MSRGHEFKGGTTDKAFQELCFMWERGAPVDADFRLFNFQYILHAQEPITWSNTNRDVPGKNKRQYNILEMGETTSQALSIFKDSFILLHSL